MFDFWESDLTEEETEALVSKAAFEIKRRKLSVPAILAFETHKPLSYVGANAAVAFAPFLVPFFGFNAVNDYSRLFAKRDNVERLLRKLEEPDADAPEGSKED